MTVSDPAAAAASGEATPRVARPPSLAEAVARAVLVVTGTVQRDPATGHRSLRVGELLRGERHDLALLSRLPVPDVAGDGHDELGDREVVLVVGDGAAPGSPAGAPAGPYLLADPRHVDSAQVKRVLAGLPALPPVDGTPDELAAAADLVLVGGSTGATRPPATTGVEAGDAIEAEIEVEVAVRELLAARPGKLAATGLAGRPVGPSLAVADRPRLWVTVEAGVADRFRRSVPGPWFVAVDTGADTTAGDGARLRSLTRSSPEEFLTALRTLRARLRTVADGEAEGGEGR